MAVGISKYPPSYYETKNMLFEMYKKSLSAAGLLDNAAAGKSACPTDTFTVSSQQMATQLGGLSSGDCQKISNGAGLADGAYGDNKWYQAEAAYERDLRKAVLKDERSRPAASTADGVTPYDTIQTQREVIMKQADAIREQEKIIAAQKEEIAKLKRLRHHNGPDAMDDAMWRRVMRYG
jgi:hypothetical protein